jgi:galactitol-specific phosphotransferase system IIB component
MADGNGMATSFPANHSITQNLKNMRIIRIVFTTRLSASG